MGIFDAIKGEVKREFIARPDESKDMILYKHPDRNIRLLTQLTVQQDEVAVFFKEGKVVGTVEAGTHTLDGKSIPFLSMLIDAATGGDFLMSELYFVSTRQFTNLPFGGMIDNVTDPTTKIAVGIRIFGEYAVQVTDATKLILTLVGTQNLQTNDQLTDWFKELLMKETREVISTDVAVDNKPILGIAARSTDLEGKILAKTQEELAEYGVVVAKLGNFTVSIKEDDEATLKQMTRDFAYAGNMAAADAALKLGMAKGMQGGAIGGAAAGAVAGAVAMGAGMGIGMSAANSAMNPQPVQPVQPVQPQAPVQQ